MGSNEARNRRCMEEDPPCTPPEDCGPPMPDDDGDDKPPPETDVFLPPEYLPEEIEPNLFYFINNETSFDPFPVHPARNLGQFENRLHVLSMYFQDYAFGDTTTNYAVGYSAFPGATSPILPIVSNFLARRFGSRDRIQVYASGDTVRMPLIPANKGFSTPTYFLNHQHFLSLFPEGRIVLIGIGIGRKGEMSEIIADNITTSSGATTVVAFGPIQSPFMVHKVIFYRTTTASAEFQLGVVIANDNNISVPILSSGENLFSEGKGGDQFAVWHNGIGIGNLELTPNKIIIGSEAKFIKVHCLQFSGGIRVMSVLIVLIFPQKASSAQEPNLSAATFAEGRGKIDIVSTRQVATISPLRANIAVEQEKKILRQEAIDNIVRLEMQILNTERNEDTILFILQERRRQWLARLEAIGEE